MIRFDGTTFKEVVEEAAKYMQRVSGTAVFPPDVRILTVNMERAMEGTYSIIVTVTLSPIKTMEGVKNLTGRGMTTFSCTWVIIAETGTRKNVSIRTRLKT